VTSGNGRRTGGRYHQDSWLSPRQPVICLSLPPALPPTRWWRLGMVATTSVVSCFAIFRLFLFCLRSFSLYLSDWTYYAQK